MIAESGGSATFRRSASSAIEAEGQRRCAKGGRSSRGRTSPVPSAWPPSGHLVASATIEAEGQPASSIEAEGNPPSAALNPLVALRGAHVAGLRRAEGRLRRAFGSGAHTAATGRLGHHRKPRGNAGASGRAHVVPEGRLRRAFGSGAHTAS